MNSLNEKVTSGKDSINEDNFELNSPPKIVDEKKDSDVKEVLEVDSFIKIAVSEVKTSHVETLGKDSKNEDNFELNPPPKIVDGKKYLDVEEVLEDNSSTKIAVSEVKTSHVETSFVAVKTFVNVAVNTSPVKFADEVLTSAKKLVDVEVNKTSPQISPAKISNLKEQLPQTSPSVRVAVRPSRLREVKKSPEKQNLALKPSSLIGNFLYNFNTI